MAQLAQDWIATNCSEFIGKGEWLPNLLDVNCLGYHVWGVMFEHYVTARHFIRGQRTDSLKKVLQLI